MFKSANSQDVFYASMTDDKNVTIKNLNLFIPNLIPFVETQLMFKLLKITIRYLKTNVIQKDYRKTSNTRFISST